MITSTLHYDLFHEKLLRKRLASFGFPSNLAARFSFMEKWLQFSTDGHVHNQLTQAEFLHDLFVEILGYRSPFHNDAQLVELEFHPESALGFFGEETSDIVAEIVISDHYHHKPEPRQPSTEWLIVTDFRCLWLYHRDYPSLFVQSFIFEELAQLEKMREFYFLLSRRTLLTGVPTSKEPSRTAQLLQECQQLENDVLRAFYQQYAKIRGQLIKDFRYRLQQFSNTIEQTKPKVIIVEEEIEQEQQIEYEAFRNAQKLLNRVIFMTFGGSHGILPRHLIRDAYEFKNPYLNQPVWENYKAIFRWMRQGNSRHIPPISGYDWSLFIEDPILDQELFVGDELCRQIKELNRFDLKEEISPAILACLWDELVKDIGQFKKDPRSLTKKRTPKFPAKILLQTELAVHQVKQYLYSQNNYEIPATDTVIEDRIAFWQHHYHNLQQLKIIHSRCGAGIILIALLDFLVTEYQNTYRQLLSLDALPHPHYDAINHDLEDNLAPHLGDDLESKIENGTNSAINGILPPLELWIMHILRNHLYGCDIFAEMVEIARLNLELRLLPLSLAAMVIDSHLLVGQVENCEFDSSCRDAIAKGKALIIGKL
ncbi:MAG: hypothetical protein WCO45_09130 [Pseudanabaena sp. ELA607]